jgi:hypothetical protein
LIRGAVRRRRFTRAALLTIGALAATGGSAFAKTYPANHQVVGYTTPRVDRQIGFIPIKLFSPNGESVSVKVDGDVYRGAWANATVGRGSTTEALKYMRRDAKPPLGQRNHLLFADRELSRSEARTFKVVLDLARDADVLVVSRKNAACSGLTSSQARAIARGAITRWSEVVPPASGQADKIDLRDTVINELYEPRLGAVKKPDKARGAADGGVSAVAGSTAVAAVTSWSRVRTRRDVCAVPLDGVAPSNASVHARTYRAAYRLTVVAVRKRQADAYSRTLRQLYLKGLTSKAATEAFVGTGLLMAASPPPPDTQTNAPGSNPDAVAPTTDAQGRTISARRDDDGAAAALGGERFRRATETGESIFAFEPDGALRQITRDNTGGGAPCYEATGGWALIAGWRYAENGGGLIAQVQFYLQGRPSVRIDLPGDNPTSAYLDGQAYGRSREFKGDCP